MIVTTGGQMGGMAGAGSQANSITMSAMMPPPPPPPPQGQSPSHLSVLVVNYYCCYTLIRKHLRHKHFRQFYTDISVQTHVAYNSSQADVGSEFEFPYVKSI